MECDFREAESPNLGWRLKRRHFSDSKINGRETNDSFPPTEPISTGTTNGRYGAGRAVAALTVEWLLSVRSRDLRWGTRQRARRAASGHFRTFDRADALGPPRRPGKIEGHRFVTVSAATYGNPICIRLWRQGLSQTTEARVWSGRRPQILRRSF